MAYFRPRRGAVGELPWAAPSPTSAEAPGGGLRPYLASPCESTLDAMDSYYRLCLDAPAQADPRVRTLGRKERK